MSDVSLFNQNFFKQLQQLQIKTRKNYLGLRQGAHLSPKRGHGLELADFRPYAPGDDFRHVDWGAYARSERLYLREFREETELNILMLIDASTSMAFPEKSSKFELAKNLALALSYVALQTGDAVRFAALGNASSANFKSPRSFQKIVSFLNKQETKSQVDFTREIRKSLASAKIPGKCFVFSDFLFDSEAIFSGLDLIRAKNFEISLVQILSPNEARLEYGEGLRLQDSETGEELEFASSANLQKEYAEVLSKHLAELENYCAKGQIPLASILSGSDLKSVLFEVFLQKGFFA